MPQSLAQVYLHLVFSTINRDPVLSDSNIRNELFHYLGGTCNALGCPILRVGGVADHVHLLCRFGRSIRIEDLLREVKRESSKWLKQQSATLARFQWQNGYGAFSISPGHVDRLVDYIETQESHHSVESFQDEFRRLLSKYKIDYDERYVWD